MVASGEAQNGAVYKPALSELVDDTVKDVDDLSDGDSDGGEVSQCGYGRCTPRWLQKFNDSKALLAAVSWFAFIQNLVVNGIVFVNITTIERRFELSSRQAALLPVSYELSAGFCALFFGFLGSFMHIGKMLTFAALCLSAGSFISCLPHVLAGPYQLGSQPSEQCDVSGGSVLQCSQDASGSNYVSLFVIGQILHGVGGGAIFTLGSPYMDENIRTENTPLYIGLMQMFAMFGPALGFMGGGLLLTNYVDFTRVDMSQITLTPSDPRWVGAWWIAYLVTATAGLTVAFFMACFPRQLAKTKELKKTRKSLAHKGKGETGEGVDEKQMGAGHLLSTQWSFLRHLLTNPIWVLLTVCTTVETGAVIGFATFMPKMLQFQFSLTSTKAALLSGAIFIPGAAGGVLVGGLMPKWLKVGVRGLLGQCLVCSLTVLVLSFTFLVRCDSTPFAGITQPYIPNSNLSTAALGSLTDVCNANCSCTTVSYDPVCGVNGVQYFSSCHAGCLTAQTVDDGTTAKVYSDCACITGASGDAMYSASPMSVAGNMSQWYQAVSGPCPSSCNMLYVFLPLFFLIILMNFFSVPANQAATLRCVPDKQRSFAFGVQDFFLRYCGNVLGPLILGTVFDLSCVLWQEDCGHRGSCWVYDGSMLAMGFLGLCFTVKVISSIAYIVAIMVYRPPPKIEEISLSQDVADEGLLAPLNNFHDDHANGKPPIVSNGNGAAHA